MNLTPRDVAQYRIYSNKRRGACYIFRASNVALIRGRAYLKIGRDKEIFSFNLTVYSLSVRKFYSDQEQIRIARILDRELNGRAVKLKHNQYELKNIAFDEKKFPMLF